MVRAAALIFLSQQMVNGATVEEKIDLFVPGKRSGFPLYRIPSLAGVNETHILAFAEGRGAMGFPVSGCCTMSRDLTVSCMRSQVQIVMRMSTDGGQTWGNETKVASEAGHVVGNPAPVVLNSSTILLVYCNNNHKVITQTLNLATMAWSAPRDITAMAVSPEWDTKPGQAIGSGPPGGIVLDSGRILVAFWHLAKEKMLGQGGNIRSHVMYSDDGGVTFNHTAALRTKGNFSTSESQVASADGGKTVIITARTQDQPAVPTAISYRSVAVSKDGGASWSDFASTSIPDPTCEGSTIGHNGIYYMSSGVARVAGNRSNVSLSQCGPACMQGGYRNWETILTLEPGLSSYSSLAPAGRGTLLCLYEVGGGEAIKSLRLARIKL